MLRLHGLSRRMRKDVANLQDVLTGALIGLARATTNAQPTKDTWHLMISALFATLTNVNFSAEDIETFTRRVHEETRRLVPDCSCCQNPCGHNDDYDMRKLWSAQEDIRKIERRVRKDERRVEGTGFKAVESEMPDD